MKLMTKEIEKKLEKYPRYSQDGKGKDADVVCKFFSPIGGWTWYVLEGEKFEGENGADWEFYGYVVGEFPEYGYFCLSELESVRLPGGLGIERDRWFAPCKLGDVVDHITY